MEADTVDGDDDEDDDGVVNNAERLLIWLCICGCGFCF